MGIRFSKTPNHRSRFPSLLGCVALAAAAALTIAPQMAQACCGCEPEGELKTIAGADCVVRSVDAVDSTFTTSAYYDWEGGICNTSSSLRLKVTCPVIRERNVERTDQTICVRVHFSQNPVVSQQEYECTLYHRQAYGTGIFFSEACETHHNSAAELTAISATVGNNSFARGYTHITCILVPRLTIPGHSCLRSLFWGERG